MSFYISEVNNKITLTRGDSFWAKVTVYDAEGKEYTPQDGDVIRFAMKKHYSDKKTLLLVEIPNDTLLLKIAPEDTKLFDFGLYVYDIQITFADGTVDTFIKGKIDLTEEVE